MKQTFAKCRLIASYRRGKPRFYSCVLVVLSIFFLPTHRLLAADAPRRILLSLGADDVLPTGNEWIALPEIGKRLSNSLDETRDAPILPFSSLSHCHSLDES